MEDQDDWIDERVDAAVSQATGTEHIFQDHLTAELKRLLNDEFLTVLKQTEIDAIAKALLAASET